MKKKFILTIVLTAFLVMAISNSAMAEESSTTSYAKPAELKSIGRLEYDKNKDGILKKGEDVIFDAEDLYYLWAICQ